MKSEEFSFNVKVGGTYCNHFRSKIVKKTGRKGWIFGVFTGLSRSTTLYPTLAEGESDMPIRLLCVFL
jgi:hypothetical protein